MSRFHEMVAHIPESSTVILVGAKQENLHQFHNFSSGRRLEALFQIPKNLPDLIQNSYLPPSKGLQEERFHIPRNHPYSMGEIIMDAELLEIEGNCWRISLPIGLANFGLIRLQLGDENLFAKVVGSTGQAPRDGKKHLGKEELDCLVSFLNEEHAKRSLKQLQQAKLIKS